ncbi:bifunctional adenosylcobinamide kinase/adenosylcobinamide-phosphate guanylyltransferase [Paraconexibacter sp.]|uniref:bifunctional adenosylcobinamide kinase/adenosylcobinamide-phosphate guanylyltransferase n=1 Tax=Paraconexibacter sp. TaxID=2949640 RepID=UPI003561DC6E
MSLALVLGGTRSGKSARAEALASATGLPVTYVATGAAIDDEMRARIAAHRAGRPDTWATVEPHPGTDPLATAARIARHGGCALLDGIGGWIATALHEGAADPDAAARAVAGAATRLAQSAPSAPGHVIVVAEQVGAGVTPMDALSRTWVDLVGDVSRTLAVASATVELVVAGGVVPVTTPSAPAAVDLAALRTHGDTAVRPGDADHAVNVLADGTPGWLRDVLRDALETTSGRYPDERVAVAALAGLHGRDPREVVPANGAAAALWLLGPALRPRRAAVVHPAFTETEAGLRAYGIPVVRVLRDPAAGFALDPDAVPDDADLVVVGTPASPSGTLDPRAAVLALRRPGRTVVVDEAFMDLVPGEPGSLAACPDAPDDVVVVRSLTKSLALPGLRAGYALAAAPVADRLRAVRPPWSVNAVALAALAAVARRPEVLAAAAARAQAEREDLVARLDGLPHARTWPSATNFVLVEIPDGPRVVAALRDRGIAVRHAATFPGLGPDHLRLTARDATANAKLADALADVLTPVPLA